MDFSLFQLYLSKLRKKKPNIAQDKSESAEMWEIQLIWGFWWHYKSGGGLYKFGGGRRMAVTSNFVNEKSFSSWNPERRPDVSNSYRLIPVHRQMMAVEAVKEKCYCFLCIVNPTYYQSSRGWGPWLVSCESGFWSIEKWKVKKKCHSLFSRSASEKNV